MTDEELLASPDPEHFGLFYRRHVRSILGFHMRAARDPDVAADLAAETFAAALVARRRFRPERASATTWLFGIAAHKLADWQRRGYAEDRVRRRLGIEQRTLTDADRDDIARMASDQAAVALLAELPAEQREAVSARVLDDRDYAGIAGDQGVSEQVIRKRVSRGLAALRSRAR